MYRATGTEIRNLPDTPFNRRLVKIWAEQDERGERVQRTLFSQPVATDVSTPVRIPQNVSADLTFRIQPDEFEPLVDQTQIDRAIVSRMTAGSSRSRTFSSKDVFEYMLSSINVCTEFPAVYQQKKNKCATVMSLMAWIKKNEKFKFPSDETGDELREVLSSLATNVMAEYLAPPKLVAAIQMSAMFGSNFHKAMCVSDFHSGMCHADDEFESFKNDCAQGLSDDSVLKFVNPTALPGYDRLTGSHSAENWVEIVTALIDSASFLDIIHLEELYNKSLDRWKSFQIGRMAPKQARSTEQELFSALSSAADRAGMTMMDESARATHMLQGISLSLMLHGRIVEAKQLIQDNIATTKLGKAALTRKFVFDQYQQQYEFQAHHVSVVTTIKAAKPDTVLIASAGLGVGQGGGIMLNCKDCAHLFEFTLGNQAFYKEKKIEHQPSRCDVCSKKNKATMAGLPCLKFKKEGGCSYGDRCRFQHESPVVMCLEEDPTVLYMEEESEEEFVYTESSDWDSDEK
jgi:hypothetical protein